LVVVVIIRRIKVVESGEGSWRGSEPADGNMSVTIEGEDVNITIPNAGRTMDGWTTRCLITKMGICPRRCFRARGRAESVLADGLEKLRGTDFKCLRGVSLGAATALSE
jgi:hypothetical protein